MNTFLFTTAFRRPNFELLPGEVHLYGHDAFKFHSTGSVFYYFVIKKDEKGSWCWVDGHTASLERVTDLGEKIGRFFARRVSDV
ncbi:MAG: hypothetical protein EOO61_06060 [Hymenobacter sp.]|nr:MAG: hypothetical protein EOO61_06060 [Hymenobacter sp.]